MMVCPYDETRLLLILQVDHSRIAGLFAARWGNREFSKLKPYPSMVLAAQEHDSGWSDWEIKPTVGADGHPIDYIGSVRNLGKGIWLDFYRNGINRVAARDPYAAYNMSMHGEGLLTRGMGLLPYMPDYAADADARRFIAEQQALRETLLPLMRANAQSKEYATEEHLWTNFKYMEVMDQLAQFVCNRYPFNSSQRKNGPTNRLSDTPVPVRPGHADTILTVDIQDDKNAIVKPFPFDVDPLVVTFQARLLPNRSYADQDDFLNHFYGGGQITISYSLHAA